MHRRLLLGLLPQNETVIKGMHSPEPGQSLPACLRAAVQDAFDELLNIRRRGNRRTDVGEAATPYLRFGPSQTAPCDAPLPSVDTNPPAQPLRSAAAKRLRAYLERAPKKQPSGVFRESEINLASRL